MAEMTENDIILMPGLVCRCKFTSMKVKEEEEDLLHKVITVAVARLAHLANVSTTEEKKDG